MSGKDRRTTMTRNMGMPDRMIRTVMAVVLAALVLTGQITGTWAIVASIVAAVFLATSLVSFCPLYRLVGMNTCSRA
jgi:hypothetical protein